MFQASSSVAFRHGMRNGIGNGRAPLSDDQIRGIAPSVFADKPWEGMTHKYLFIPTSNLVTAMRKEGYEVVQALQGRTRIEGKGDFTKHLLRFALPKAEQVHGSVPELVLINSHDGTSSYRLMLGVFRMICKNGLLLADVVEDLRFRHSKSLQDEILEGTGTLVREVPRINDQIDRFAGIKLLPNEMATFAKAAHSMRWTLGEHAPVEPEQLLSVRRIEDRSNDLYTTLNIVQENLIRGGLDGRTSTNKRTSTRAVAGVTENVRLNTALSIIASEMARHKGH